MSAGITSPRRVSDWTARTRAGVAASLLLTVLAPAPLGAQTLPGIPQNLTGSASGFIITISWQAPATGAQPTGYILDAGTAAGVYNFGSLPMGLLTSISFPAPTGVFYFRVHAENAVGPGPSTPEVSVTVGAATTAPSAPQYLALSLVNNDLDVTWYAPAVGAPITNYILQVGTSPGSRNVGSGSVGTNTFWSSGPNTGGLLPNGVYYFRVIAENAYGQGPPSSEVVLTIGSGTALPSAPPVTATAVGDTLTVAWGAPAVGAPITNYYLQAGTSPGVYNLINGSAGSTGSGAVTHLSVAGVPNGVYYFRVTAQNAYGIGPPSPEVSVTIGSGTALPSAPQNLTFTVVGSKVELIWSPPAIGVPITTYFLQAGTSSGLYDLYSGPIATTTYVPLYGVPNGVYYFRVTAENAYGQGPPTPEVSVTVGSGTAVPSPPQSLVGAGANNTLSLNWQPPAIGGPFTRYNLQIGRAPGDYGFFNGSTGLVTSIASPAGDGTYFARVGAENAFGQGSFTPEIVVTVGPPCPRPAPPVLSGSRTGNVVTLSWTTPSGAPPSGYSLQLGSGTTDTYSTYPVGLVNTVSGPVGPGTLRLRVLASVACGFSAPSNEVTIAVP